MASSSKRQTTFAKLQREHAVREKHARKQSERLARKQQKRDAKLGLAPPGDPSAEPEDRAPTIDGASSAAPASELDEPPRHAPAA